MCIKDCPILFSFSFRFMSTMYLIRTEKDSLLWSSNIRICLIQKNWIWIGLGVLDAVIETKYIYFYSNVDSNFTFVSFDSFLFNMWKLLQCIANFFGKILKAKNDYFLPSESARSPLFGVAFLLFCQFIYFQIWLLFQFMKNWLVQGTPSLIFVNIGLPLLHPWCRRQQFLMEWET